MVAPRHTPHSSEERMPIGGIVISGQPGDENEIAASVSELNGIEVHGTDSDGNIVAVLDTESSEEMEKLIDRINKHEKVLNVGLTYLNTEDEAQLMSQGI